MLRHGSKFAYVGDEEHDMIEEVGEEELRQSWTTSTPVEIVSEEEEGEGEDVLGIGDVESGVESGTGSSLAGGGPPKPLGAASSKAATTTTTTTTTKKKKKLTREMKNITLKSKSMTPRKPSSSVQRQVADTNVLAVDLARLTDIVPVHSGDVTLCIACGAALSAISTPRFHGQSISIDTAPAAWSCEFCGCENMLEIVPEEVPKDSSVDYLLRPAPIVPSHAIGDSASKDSAAAALGDVIFCVDISGSMCVTTEVAGHLELRGNSERSERRRREVGLYGDDEIRHGSGDMMLMSRHMQRQVRQPKVTYVSRLQSVQGAVEKQLTRLSSESPNTRVGLITFASAVTIVGDGSAEPVTLAGDKLDNYDQLDTAARAAVAAGGCMSSEDGVGQRAKELEERLFALEEGGGTALGPALVVAVEMAAASARPGARVIVCTDGVANVGLGRLDAAAEDSSAAKAADTFYRSVAERARGKGVIVSVVTIAGAGECRLEHLGTVADVTGGDVETVDPLRLRENFASLLKKPVIATDVRVTMLLHHRLMFRGDGVTAAAAAAIGTSSSTSTTKSTSKGDPTTITAHAADHDPTTSSTGAAIAAAAVSARMDMGEDKTKNMVGATHAIAHEAAPISDSLSSSAGISANEAGDTTGTLLQGSKLVREVGNVTEDSEMFLEFGLAPAKTTSRPALSLERVPEQVPFQLQVEFTRPSGERYLRVLTDTQATTKNRESCHSEVDVAICSAHATQKSSRLAQEGGYEAARLNAFAFRSMLGRQAATLTSSKSQRREFLNFCDVYGELDDSVRAAQLEEDAGGPGLGGGTSMGRGSSQGMLSSSVPAARKAERRNRRSDVGARLLFKGKKKSSKAFRCQPDEE